jgi:hypothetical protein
MSTYLALRCRWRALVIKNEAARAKAEAFIAEKGFKNVVGTRVRPM